MSSSASGPRHAAPPRYGDVPYPERDFGGPPQSSDDTMNTMHFGNQRPGYGPSGFGGPGQPGGQPGYGPQDFGPRQSGTSQPGTYQPGYGPDYEGGPEPEGPDSGHRPPADGGRKLPGNAKTRTRVLVGGALVVVVGVVIGGVIIAPQLRGTKDDPGCKAYNTTALPAYNQTVSDLNAQAHQSKLTADLSAAIGDLTTAAGQSRSQSVRSALNGLRTQLSTVRQDVKKGYIPSSAVPALNHASSAADSAC